MGFVLVGLSAEVAFTLVLDLSGVTHQSPSPETKTKRNKKKLEIGIEMETETKNTHHTNKPLPTRNPTRLRQLNIRTAIPQPIDPQLGQRDQKLIHNFPGLGVLDRQHAVPDLLHDDRPPAETRLLGAVSLEFEPFARV